MLNGTKTAVAGAAGQAPADGAGTLELAALRAFDAFPLTHHVECAATAVPG